MTGGTIGAYFGGGGGVDIYKSFQGFDLIHQNDLKSRR